MTSKNIDTNSKSDGKMSSGVSKSESPQDCEKYCEKYKEQLAMALAEFKNYQARIANRQEQDALLLKKQVFADIIDLFENLHIALESIDEELRKDSRIQGVLHILHQYKDLLKKYGVQEISYNKGDTFDISDTQVVGKIKPEEEPLKGKVAQLVAPGYKIGEVIIKPARILVFDD